MSPQASDELRNEWRDEDGGLTDGVASAHLAAAAFVFQRGMIRPPHRGYVVTEKDYSAIDFLCDEFDYGWDSQSVEETSPLPEPQTP